MWPWHHHTLSFSLGMQHKDVGGQPDMLLCTIGPTLINTAVGGTTQTALQTPSSRSGGSIETWLLAWAPLTMQDLSLDTNLCVCIPVSLFTCLSYLCVSYLSVSHLSLSPLCLFTSLSPVCLLPVCLSPVSLTSVSVHVSLTCVSLTCLSLTCVSRSGPLGWSRPPWTGWRT